MSWAQNVCFLKIACPADVTLLVYKCLWACAHLCSQSEASYLRSNVRVDPQPSTPLWKHSSSWPVYKPLSIYSNSLSWALQMEKTDWYVCEGGKKDGWQTRSIWKWQFSSPSLSHSIFVFRLVLAVSFSKTFSFLSPWKNPVTSPVVYKLFSAATLQRTCCTSNTLLWRCMSVG